MLCRRRSTVPRERRLIGTAAVRADGESAINVSALRVARLLWPEPRQRARNRMVLAPEICRDDPPGINHRMRT